MIIFIYKLFKYYLNLYYNLNKLQYNNLFRMEGYMYDINPFLNNIKKSKIFVDFGLKFNLFGYFKTFFNETTFINNLKFSSLGFKSKQNNNYKFDNYFVHKFIYEQNNCFVHKFIYNKFINYLNIVPNSCYIYLKNCIKYNDLKFILFFYRVFLMNYEKKNFYEKIFKNLEFNRYNNLFNFTSHIIYNNIINILNYKSIFEDINCELGLIKLKANNILNINNKEVKFFKRPYINFVLNRLHVNYLFANFIEDKEYEVLKKKINIH